MEEELLVPYRGETFGEWVTRIMDARGLTVMVCSRRTKMKHSQWNAIMNDEPRRGNGEPPQRSQQTARRVALGLGVPERFALAAANFGDPSLYAKPPPGNGAVVIHENGTAAGLTPDDQAKRPLTREELEAVLPFVESLAERMREALKKPKE